MLHVVIATLLVGAFILVFFVVLAVRAILEDRRENAAPFRDYFGPAYDRDLLQQSSLSETEEWLADRPARFTPFRFRDPGTSEQRARVSGAGQLDRD
jgi:hypothetical protein